MAKLLIAVVGVAAGVGIGATVLQPEPADPVLAGLPLVEQEAPGPGEPPVIWVTAEIEQVGSDELVVREGDGPELRLARFAAGATRFFRLVDAEWRPARPASAEPGTPACLEALLDGERLLALRIFLEAACAPVP